MLEILIQLVHLCLIILTVITPFVEWETNQKLILILHITWCLSLLVHWYFNNDVCALTFFEQMITKKDMSEGFIYNIISPIYKITSIEIKIITILLMCVSIYKFF